MCADVSHSVVIAVDVVDFPAAASDDDDDSVVFCCCCFHFSLLYLFLRFRIYSFQIQNSPNVSLHNCSANVYKCECLYYFNAGLNITKDFTVQYRCNG